MVTKANSKPCQISEMELFLQNVTSFATYPESCHTSKMVAFSKNSRKLKAFATFAKSFILDVWQVSEYASELTSKVMGVSFLNQFKYQR